MRTLPHLVLAAIALTALAACSDRSEKVKADTTAVAATPAPSRTLAQTLESDGEHGALARVARNAGLGEVLGGVGPYTVFAPADSALKTSDGVDFTDPALKAEGAALLRAHVVPGALSRADIAAAVARSGGKGAQMRTMAGELLTFTGDAGALVVQAPDGSSVRLTGEETRASNGVLQPIDGLLINPAAPAS